MSSLCDRNQELHLWVRSLNLISTITQKLTLLSLCPETHPVTRRTHNLGITIFLWEVYEIVINVSISFSLRKPYTNNKMIAVDHAVNRFTDYCFGCFPLLNHNYRTLFKIPRATCTAIARLQIAIEVQA